MANDGNIQAVTALIYGASLPDTPQEAMVRIGSTPYNRALTSRQHPEFGSTVQEALYKPDAYYEFSGGNKKVENLKKGIIDDENLYKRALSVAYALENGTIEKTKDQFFQTPAAVEELTKSKRFNYKLVDTNANIKNGGKGRGNDSWNFMSYKEEPVKKSTKKEVDNGQLSAHFNKQEFNQKNAPLKLDKFEIDPELVNKLEDLRTAIGLPIKITSGYRSKDYNTRVGGAKDSQHLYGKAADIMVDGLNSRQLQAVAKKVGFAYTQVYSNKPHLHVDIKKRSK